MFTTRTTSSVAVVIPIPTEARPVSAACSTPHMHRNEEPSQGRDVPAACSSALPLEVPYSGSMRLRMLPPANATQQELAHELTKKGGWLNQAEERVQKHYGLQLRKGFVATVEARNIDGPNNAGAMVRHMYPPGETAGRYPALVIDTTDFEAAKRWNAFDKMRDLLVHETVHLYMGQTMNFIDIDDRRVFSEGTAELLAGGDATLKMALDGIGGPGKEQALVDTAKDPWRGGIQQYGAAYAAMRYLHAQIKSAGGPGIRLMMDHLSTHKTHTLDDGFAHLAKTLGGAVAGYTSEEHFINDFVRNGAQFIREKMDLKNKDNGAIGGADAG